jgi:hypothetical protein
MTKIINNQTQSKWNIRKDGSTNVLFIEDAPAPCPFRMPTIMPHPNIAGQAIPINPICCDRCPFFIYTENGLFNKLKFACANGHEIDVYKFDKLQ